MSDMHKMMIRVVGFSKAFTGSENVGPYKDMKKIEGDRKRNLLLVPGRRESS